MPREESNALAESKHQSSRHLLVTATIPHHKPSADLTKPTCTRDHCPHPPRPIHHTMNVEYAFICDYAESSNKLTAVGIGIDTIYAKTVPVVHQQLFAVLGLNFTINETRRTKVFEMRVQDADAHDVIPPVTANRDIPAPGKGLTYRTYRSVNGLYGLRFQNFGDYQISWIIDGVEVCTRHFRVAQMPEQ